MFKDYSHKNLRSASFKNKDLSNAVFSGSDLRGADFTGSDLSGADLTDVKTGFTPAVTFWIFLCALFVSALSGYVAMLAGHTIQNMYHSADINVRIAGIACSVVIILFIVLSIWKGLGHSFRFLVLPVILFAFIVGLFSYLSGAGSGMGALYLTLAVLLVLIMFVVGTVARAAAGNLSNILFVIVAMFGAFFGRSMGGGIGTIVVAVSCVIISKRALRGAKGFEKLRRITGFITQRFGTSFRNSKLADTNFSRADLHNSDFSRADISMVHWGRSKKVNCIID